MKRDLDEFGRVDEDPPRQAHRRCAEAVRGALPLRSAAAVDSILTYARSGRAQEGTFQVIATIIERKKVEGKINSLTAQGMTQGGG